MLGALEARILAIAGDSSAEPIRFLRYPRAIVGGSGNLFDLGAGIPNFLICGPSPALLMPKVMNLFDVSKT